MNTSSSPEKKIAILKSLAIVGFVGIILFIAWLSVQIINVAPSAFSSLASIISGIDQYKETIVEEANDTIVITTDVQIQNSGDPVKVMWNQLNTPGSYTFTYECQDGVAVDVLEVSGLRSIACNTNYDLGNTNGTTIIIDSEKASSTAVKYTVAFRKNDSTEYSLTESSSIVVTNPTIKDTPVAEVIETEVVSATTTEPEVVVTPPPVEPKYTYEIPVSDPNGTINLATRFLNVGEINGRTFTAGRLEQDSTGAFQFEVKNIGTKTSGTWKYSLELPGDETYTSDAQVALKPNERAVIAIGFPIENETSHAFKVEVTTSNETSSANNEFTQRVTIVK